MRIPHLTTALKEPIQEKYGAIWLLGALASPAPLSTRYREIAESLGKHLKVKGLLLIGLDIIGDYLTQINVASLTCFQEITAQSGINIAGLFINAVEKHWA